MFFSGLKSFYFYLEASIVFVYILATSIGVPVYMECFRKMSKSFRTESFQFLENVNYPSIPADIQTAQFCFIALPFPYKSFFRLYALLIASVFIPTAVLPSTLCHFGWIHPLLHLLLLLINIILIPFIIICNSSRFQTKPIFSIQYYFHQRLMVMINVWG